MIGVPGSSPDIALAHGQVCYFLILISEALFLKHSVQLLNIKVLQIMVVKLKCAKMCPVSHKD